MSAEETKDQAEPVNGAAPGAEQSPFTVVDKRVSTNVEESETPEAVELPTEVDPVEFLLLQQRYEAALEEIEARRIKYNDLAKGAKKLESQHDERIVRLERDMARAVSRSKGQLLDKLLHVLDGFQLSLDSIPLNEHTKPIMSGVQMIYRQFLTQLSDLGLLQYAPLGESFDPERHEAVQKIEVDDEAKDGTVVQIIRHGYIHDGRVLRAAQVAVGTAPKAVVSESAAEEDVEEPEPKAE